MAGLDPVCAPAVDDGDQPDHAGIALHPLPRIGVKGASPSHHLGNIATHVLDGGNAGLEQRPVRRIPFGKIVDGIAAGGLLVFRQQKPDLWPIAMRPERSCERMIDRAAVDADELGVALDQPLRRLLAQAGRMAEIADAVRVMAMPSGDEQHNVAVSDRRVARARSSLPIKSHFCFGMESTTPVPKKRSSDSLPTGVARWIKWIGALRWVDVCITVENRWAIAPCRA
jgi:hypothetical protein